MEETRSALVCGCGPSLAALREKPGCLTIGVNDVGRRFDPDYLVVVNPREEFSDERFGYIKRSGARAVYSQYSNLPLDSAKLEPIRFGRYNGVDFGDPRLLHYTQNSPYVAVCLAIQMGARRIGLIGVDFTEGHSLAPRLPQIEAEYGRLRDACSRTGIELFNLSPISRLTALPRKPLEEFLREARSVSMRPLNVVSYATTPVAGVPAVLARCVAAETPNHARCVWASSDYGNGVRFEGGIEWSRDPQAAEAALVEADVVIAHNGRIDDRHRRMVSGKPVVTLAHNYAWNVDARFVQGGMPGLVVGQYQATLPEFAGWIPVANPVPLGEPAFSPETKGERIAIAYTPSGQHESYPEGHRLYWHGKGYATTMRVLDALARRYPIEVIAVRERQMSHAEALAAKRRAHIVIDECVTGSYHRNSLEGLACGAVVVNGVGLRPVIADMLRQCAGGEAESPFAHATLATLETVLAGLIESGPASLAEAGRRNRTWMETHWRFADQWRRVWEPAIGSAREATQPARRGRALPPEPSTHRTDPMSREPAPRVSVVIPFGGGERLPLLAATLATLRRMRGIDEVVIAELAPAPDAAEAARAAGARYVFLPHEGVFNKSRILNAGSALASGELQLWLDSDIILPESFLAAATDELRRRQLDCLVPWTSVLYLSPTDSAAVIAGARSADRCAPVNAFHTRAGACGVTVLVRTALLRSHGGLDEAFRGWGGEDNAWFHKAQVFGRAAVTQRSDQLVFHLHHPGSGGYGARAHIDGNPHYAANVARLTAMRRVTDRARFAAAFPSTPAPPPWAGARVVFLAAAADARAEARMEAVARVMRDRDRLDIACASLEPEADPGHLGARPIVAFGADAARRCAADAGAAARCIAVWEGSGAPERYGGIAHHVAAAADAGCWLWREERGDEDLARTLLGPLSLLLARGDRGTAVAAAAGLRRALVAAGTGIGDVLRATPMARALAEKGYRVTMLAVADYPGTGRLVADRRWVDEVIEIRPPSPGRPLPPCPELADAAEFEVAIFSHLAAPLRPLVRTREAYVFDRACWLNEGDTACFARAAESLGIAETLPAPFAVASARRFDLPPGTVALHAGCKKDWAFKRWGGFAALAENLAHVVAVGTKDDGAPAWPAHVRSFVGQLDLPDTAALLQQCGALVANDSGLMHLGAILGIPTFGVFGLTSPRREKLPLANMHAITKALPCEPDCHAQPLGRRDCEHHVRCLKELTAAEVLERIRPHLPAAALRAAAVRAAGPAAREKLKVGVRLDGGLGDLILAARFVEGLFLALDHCDIDVFHVAPERARFVFHRARHVRTVRDVTEFPGAQGGFDLTATALHFVRYEVRDWAKVDRVCPSAAARLREAIARFAKHAGLFERRPALDAFWARLSVREGRTASSGLDHLAAISLPPLPMLAPEPAEYEALRRAQPGLGRGGWITVHDGFDTVTRIAPGRATKCWPLAHWAALVARLRSAYPGVPIVQLGGAKSRPIPGVDVNLVGRTTLHQAAWVLKQAALHIDGDSGLVHLARALQTRAVVLFGPTDRAYYGYARNSNLGPAACGECWWSTPDWLERCPRGLAEPACMESITPEAVFAAAAETGLLPPGPIPAATLLHQALYASDAVRDGAAALAGIFAQAGLPATPITHHAAEARTGIYLHASKQWEYLFALEAVRRAGLGGGCRIADVGGGRGALAPHLAAAGHAVTVFDLDFLWDHGGDADVERRYMQAAAHGGWQARFGSLYSLPAEDGAFDAVLCVSVVEHAPYKDLILRELLRVVRPGGVVVLTFDFAAQPERFHDSLRVEIFGPRSLAQALAQIGVTEAGFCPEAVEGSAAAVARDGVAGIPSMMTVGGVALVRRDMWG